MKIVDIDIAEALQAAKHMGRGGDTELVHVNKGEENMLKAAGGSGTINPKTGLREYWDPDGGGSNTTGNAGARDTGGSGNFDSSTQSYDVASGTHGEAGAPGSGNTAPGGSLSSSRGDGSGGSSSDKTSKTPTKNDATSAPEVGANSPAKGTDSFNDKGMIPNRGNTDVQAAGSQSSTFKNPSMQVGDSTPDTFKEAFNKRMLDYSNADNSFIEDIGNFLAGSLGFHEIKPTTAVKSLNTNADWGWDPAGTIGGMAGMAAGIPFGGGIAADLISWALGRPLMMNVGPDVMQTLSNVASGNFTTGSAASGANGPVGGAGKVSGGEFSSSTKMRDPSSFGSDALHQAVQNVRGEGTQWGREGGGGGAYPNEQKPGKQTPGATGATGPAGGTGGATGGTGSTGATGATGATGTSYTWANLPVPGPSDHKWTAAYKQFKANNDIAGYVKYLQGRGQLPTGGATGPTGPTTDPSQAGSVLDSLLGGLQFPFFKPLEPFSIDMSLHDDIIRNALQGR